MALYRKGQTWYIDYYVNGRRRREAVGSNRRVAEGVLAKRKVEITENRYLDVRQRTKVTFDQLAIQYLEWSRANKRSWQRDERSIRMLKRWFSGKQLSAISTLTIERFKAQRKREVSPASVNRELSCVKHMFSKAIQWQLFDSNPAKAVRKYRENNARIRYLTTAEVKRLRHTCADWLWPIVQTALCTGMRKGEILRLRWDDVDFDRQLIYVRQSKSGEPRHVPIAAPLYPTLSRLTVISAYVFPREDGCPRQDVRGAFEGAVKRAGIHDFRFHDLRHTFASHLVMNGVDLLTVKELLGLKTLDLVQRYAHLSPSHKQKAVDMLQAFDGHYMDTLPEHKATITPLSRCVTKPAGVVKVVDAGDSKSPGSNTMPVRVRPPAPPAS